MPITLVVETGPDAGKRLVLQPGHTALVGRASWADLSVPGDSEMSGRHFVLEFEENRCILRDFKGSSGTSLNGGRVRESVLRDGDRIQAGGTLFVLHEGEVTPTPPPFVAAPAPAVPEPEAVAALPDSPPQDLLGLLREAQPLFALLDAARSPRVLQLLRPAGEEYQSLYEGEKGEELAPWGPFLVRLPAESALLEALVMEGWGDSWGVFLACDQPFAEVRKHFRKFLMVKLENEHEVYFRFYDPRVLRDYLPSCRTLEAKEFMGPTTALLLESQRPNYLLTFRADRRGVMNAEAEITVALPQE